MGNVSSPIWHQRKLITFSNHVWNVSNARGGPLGIRHAKQKTKRKQNLLNPIFVRSWSKKKHQQSNPFCAAPNWQLLVRFTKQKRIRNNQKQNENPTLKIAQPKRKMKRPVSDQVRPRSAQSKTWPLDSKNFVKKQRARSHARRNAR